MTDSPLRDAVDQAVADHYASKSLDADALAALRDRIGAASAPPSAGSADEHAADEHAADEHAADERAADEHAADEHAADADLARPIGTSPAPDRAPARPAVRARTRWLAGAVGLAVLAVAFLAWPQPALSGDRLAREIASRHVMSLKPDVEADSFDEARARLDKLDFVAVRPSEDAMPAFRLTGARYTRLGGQMGAEFQVQDALGRPCTLFQVRDDATFRDIEDTVYEIDGVRVRVWREADLLMGLAESAEPVTS